MFNRYNLYELCVQSPDDQVRVLVALHGGAPRAIGEDFCGTAAISAAWVNIVPEGRAIAIDLDPEPLALAPKLAELEIVCGDVRTIDQPNIDRVDVLHCGNFSIGEMHTRAELIAYLRHARSRLREGGVFACDIYGGALSYCLGVVEGTYPLVLEGAPPDAPARFVHYGWEHRDADPMTGMVTNALHFRVMRGHPSSAFDEDNESDEVIEIDPADVEFELTDAFVYRWRLWSIPELRDALIDAGFSATSVHGRRPDAACDDGWVMVPPIEDPDELGEDYDVFVVGRT